ADDAMPRPQKGLREMEADEAGRAGDKDGFRFGHRSGKRAHHSLYHTVLCKAREKPLSVLGEPSAERGVIHEFPERVPDRLDIAIREYEAGLAVFYDIRIPA